MSSSTDPYCYSGTHVLINKLDIRDEDELELVEARFYSFRKVSLLKNIAITSDGFRSIHSHLFQDLYEWAGVDRTTNIAKINPDGSKALFAPHEQISSLLQQTFDGIEQEDKLQGLGRLKFAKRAAFYTIGLNITHSFREGNGRVMRCFLQRLAFQAGHTFDLKKINQEDWIEASIEGSKKRDVEPMTKVIIGAMESYSGPAPIKKGPR